MTLENYEEGIFVANVPIRNGKRGRPRIIKYIYGHYTKMGDMLNVSFENGMSIIGKEAVNE